MVLQSCDLGYLALKHPANGDSATLSPRYPPQQRPVRRPSRMESMEAKSQSRDLASHSGSESRVGDAADTMSTHHSWSTVPLLCPKVQPALLRSGLPVEDRRGQRSSTPSSRNSPEARGRPTHVFWTDLEDQAKALPSPPETPRPRRLRTPELPELEPVKESRKFCSCCREENLRYHESRAKMDSQLEVALAHIRGSPARQTLDEGYESGRDVMKRR